MDSHGVQGVVNLQQRHHLREENVEDPGDGSYEEAGPGLEAVTASTDGDHAWAGLLELSLSVCLLRLT